MNDTKTSDTTLFSKMKNIKTSDATLGKKRKQPTITKRSPLLNMNNTKTSDETLFSKMNNTKTSDTLLGKKRPREQQKTRPLLKIAFPHLYRQLDSKLNPGIDIDKITCGSDRKLTWRCVEHTSCSEHIWNAIVANRTCKSAQIQCPFCETIKPTKFYNGGRFYCKCSRPSFLNENGSQKNETKIMKKCIGCQKELLLDEFNKNKSKTDGCSFYCKTCNQEQSKYRNSVQAAIIKLFLSTRKCVDCSESNPLVLECDYENNDKATKKNGNKIRSLSRIALCKVVDELKKSTVRCAWCHRLSTQSRRAKNKYVLHTMAKNNMEFVNQTKLNLGKCETCEKKVTKDNLMAFDFDHINPKEKIDSISQMRRNKPLHIVKTELKKCRLLCVTCHRIFTSKQMNYRKLEDFSEDIIKEAKMHLGDLYAPNTPKKTHTSFTSWLFPNEKFMLQ